MTEGPSLSLAELTARSLGFDRIFTMVAIPGLVATAALVVKQWTHPQAPRDRSLREPAAEPAGH